eukprot:scpid85964/ scgid5381/ 
MGDDGKLVVGVRNHKTGATHLAFVCADGIQLRAMMHYNHQYRRLMAASSDAFLLLPSGGQIESKDHSKMVTWIGKKYGLKMSTATEGRKLIESKVHVSSAFSEADAKRVSKALCHCRFWPHVRSPRPGLPKKPPNGHTAIVYE